MYKIHQYDILKQKFDKSEEENGYYSGLIIKEFWLSKIFNFADPKDWEIRGSCTNKRGKIYLLESKTGLIKGEADLIDCIELDLVDFTRNEHHHKIPSQIHNNQLPYSRTYAWVLQDIHKYNVSIPYKHPRGAVIWVNLPRNIVFESNFLNI